MKLDLVNLDYRCLGNSFYFGKHCFNILSAIQCSGACAKMDMKVRTNVRNSGISASVKNSKIVSSVSMVEIRTSVCTGEIMTHFRNSKIWVTVMNSEILVLKVVKL